jgi:pilus assembly protein Flp/PilA
MSTSSIPKFESRANETFLVVRANAGQRGSLGRVCSDENGAALIEYTVLIGLLLAGIVVTITAVGAWASGQWTALNTAL